MSDLTTLLDALDLVATKTGPVLGAPAAARLERTARELRTRTGFIGETLVLALAGGTGSGKSSLLNALAGAPVASVSRLRPHTDAPLAWIPEEAGPGLRRLLDEIGITERVAQDRFPHLAVIDLPDVDSVAEWHRRTVEDLLPRVDAVVWVFDPEKYQDPVLHAEFLRPLVAYRDQFLFVMNQVDRVDEEGRSAILTDLWNTLIADGYQDPRIFPLAAAPDEGPPLLVETFAEYLATRLEAKRVASGKILGDVRFLVGRLAQDAGVWQGAGVDFEDRWSRTREVTVDELAGDRSPATREDALCRLEDFVAAVSVEVGPAVGEQLRMGFPAVRIARALDGAAGALPEPATGGRRRKAAPPDPGPAVALLDEAVGTPMREILWDRAVLGAAIAQLGITAAQVERRLAVT